nr:MAG: hypothetical protein [uncultured archaeon]
MSGEKVDEIREKIRKIESIGRSVRQPAKKPIPKSREYGSYQNFQSECMQKVDETKPDSLSRVEVITGKEGIHSTERLAQCSILWGKHRNLDNPVSGLMSDLKTAQKKKGDINGKSEL